MGTLAQLFETGEQSSQKGHFRNLILLTRTDGKVTETEQKLLNRIASQLSISDEQVKEITENPGNYPVIPPYGKEERTERLVQFIQVALDDQNLSAEEESLITKLALALGFTDEQVHDKVAAAVNHLSAGKTLDETIEAIL